MARATVNVLAGDLVKTADLYRVRALVAHEFWQWFSANEFKVVLEVKVLWIFEKQLILGEFESLFESIFGERP